MLSAEQKRIKSAKWRAANLERARQIGRECERRRAAARALAEGRVPGMIGRPRQFTEEEKRAKRKAKSEKWNAANREGYLRGARDRQRAKRAGVFTSRALPRLTDEQRRLRDIVASNKRRARLAASASHHTVADIMHLHELQEGVCTFCGSPLDAEWHVDHWFPLALGGSNDRLNLRLLHPTCNLQKGALHPAIFQQIQPSLLIW